MVRLINVDDGEELCFIHRISPAVGVVCLIQRSGNDDRLSDSRACSNKDFLVEFDILPPSYYLKEFVLAVIFVLYGRLVTREACFRYCAIF